MVSVLAEDAARELGLPESDQKRLSTAGLLHDVGRVKQPSPPEAVLGSKRRSSCNEDGPPAYPGRATCPKEQGAHVSVASRPAESTRRRSACSSVAQEESMNTFRTRNERPRFTNVVTGSLALALLGGCRGE